MPIGSLGTPEDMKIMLRFACFASPEGHGWSPEGRLDWWSYGPVPSKPSCQKCKAIWRRKMKQRGLSDQQIRYLFSSVGASWHWDKAKRETPEDRLSNATRELIGLPRLQPTQRKNHKVKHPEPERPVFVRKEVVDDLTDDMRQANEQAQALLDAVLDERMAAKQADPTRTPADLAKQFPMPTVTMYVARVKELA